MQTALTTVMVTWTRPPEAAVTGYTVHWVSGYNCSLLLPFSSSLSDTAPDTPKGVVTAAESFPVTLSWGAVDYAHRYTVTFSMAQGTNQEGLCPTDYHTANLTVDATSWGCDI